ncbi:MAG: class I SAM-dependent methyltransferase [Acidobacteriota bacterium]|nr:class I SAM-dependent methyltransferase [Acidobacteriota bacterium]
MSQPNSAARRILIIGGTAGAGVLALARGLGADGMLICIEGDREAAARATATFARENLRDRVSVMVGDVALFIRKVSGPFDLIVVQVAEDDARARVEAHLPRLLAPGGVVQR